jgi:hypothetical protein
MFEEKSLTQYGSCTDPLRKTKGIRIHCVFYLFIQTTKRITYRQDPVPQKNGTEPYPFVFHAGSGCGSGTTLSPSSSRYMPNSASTITLYALPASDRNGCAASFEPIRILDVLYHTGTKIFFSTGTNAKQFYQHAIHIVLIYNFEQAVWFRIRPFRTVAQNLIKTNQSYRYLPENRLSCRIQQIRAARAPSGLVHSREMGHREAAILQI